MTIDKNQARAIMTWFNALAHETMPDQFEYELASKIAQIAEYPGHTIERLHRMSMELDAD
jgi:hypothetical protein